MTNKDKCQGCGGEVVPEKVNLEDYINGKLYMMEQVPGYVCQNCGEVWIPQPVINEFERMIELAQKKKPKKKKGGKYK